MTHSTDGLGPTPAVQLFILSRDRLDFCRETVASAVAQTYKNLQIIVSDNSEKEEVSEMLAREFPSVVLIRRKPSLPALSHFNKLIDEAVAPLMVLFHDDDILELDYVSKMVALLQKNLDVSAAGCNARIIRNNQLTRQRFMGDFKGNQFLRNEIDFLEPYLSLSLISPAPFPGYMYRTNIIKGLGLYFNDGGKHADVSFLASIISRAPILWTDECLFRYRFHENNDSNVELIADRLAWLRYLYRRIGIAPKSDIAIGYKYLYWLSWLKKENPRLGFFELFCILRSRRRTIGSRFVLAFSCRIAFTRISYWRRAFRLMARNFY